MNGYEKLKEDVIRDCKEGCFNENGCDHEFTRMVPAEGIMKDYTDTVCMCVSKCTHKYCDKFKWVVDRAKHYAEKTDLKWEDILNSWEEDREYWYMNYYQERNQPEIKNDKVKVFESTNEMLKSIGDKKFRCPSCGGVSKNPYECNHCGWNVCGLFGDLGKGIFVYYKNKLKGETIFMPLAWENEGNNE